MPNPPSTLRAKAEDDSITIAWNPPSSKNILVRGYTIGWGKGIPDEYTKVVDNKQRYFVIEDLSKCLLIFCSHTFLLCNPTQCPPSPSLQHLTLGLVSQLAAPPLPIVPADRFTTTPSADKSTICRKQICPRIVTDLLYDLPITANCPAVQNFTLPECKKTGQVSKISQM